MFSWRFFCGVWAYGHYGRIWRGAAKNEQQQKKLRVSPLRIE
jgi:hypothetical protein